MNGGAVRSLLLRRSACLRLHFHHNQPQRQISFNYRTRPNIYKAHIQVHPQPPIQPLKAFSTGTARMTTLKAGDKFPDGVLFSYVPWSPDTDSPTACGIPINFDASKEFADKKVVLFAVPGAFSPGCSARHLPGYIENLDKIKAKGVDLVCVIASNDAWVMSAWGKVNGVKDEIVFLCDTDIKFSKSIGLEHPSGTVKTARYAMVIDHGKIVYAEKEPAREVTVSGAPAILEVL